ncbi:MULTISPECIES: hypothetical protein [unclassified Arthrobacter]|nr:MULTISPECIES: hypothetical protein [unclassified Arthrobacter]MEC5192382.1 hypothetical protein [Arthrobacter sp. MP_M4]MEC5203867.1 hypothetical protein [Arthrobacter sp. MP_M7]
MVLLLQKSSNPWAGIDAQHTADIEALSTGLEAAITSFGLARELLISI